MIKMIHQAIKFERYFKEQYPQEYRRQTIINSISIVFFEIICFGIGAYVGYQLGLDAFFHRF